MLTVIIAPSKGDHRPRNENQIARGGRGAARGGRGRSTGAGAIATPGTKRQFDRRSGAFPDSEKKVAQGWGAEEGKAELKDEVEGAKDAEADVAAPGTPAEAEVSAIPFSYSFMPWHGRRAVVDSTCVG